AARTAASADQDLVRVGGSQVHPWRSRTVRGVPVAIQRSLSRRGRREGSRAGIRQGRLALRSDRCGPRRLRLPAVAADAASAGRMMDRFDLLGPLPAERSTTVLEASAGTGKTFALAGLVTRYVAEGVATLDQMLLITFG